MRKLLLISSLLLCMLNVTAQVKNGLFIYDRTFIEEHNVKDCIVAEYALGIVKMTDSLIIIGNVGYWKNPKPKDKRFRYVRLDNGEPVRIVKHFRSPSQLVAVSVRTRYRNYFYTNSSL